MTMYLPLGPDGTPPEGAVPGSPRYERVLATEMPAKLRLPAGVTGAALIAAGAAMVYFGNPWGVLALIVGGGALAAGGTGGLRGFTFHESPTGGFVEATPEHEAEAWYAAASASHMFPRGYRVGAGILGTLFTLVLVLEIVDPTNGPDEWKMLLLIAGLVVGLLYVAMVGRIPSEPEEERPLPPRFRELADPARPLPPEVFACQALPAARAHDADVPPRPMVDERRAFDEG